MALALAVCQYPSANTPYKRASFIPVVINVTGGVPSLDTTLSTNGCSVVDTGTGIIGLTIPFGQRGIVVGQPAVVAADGTSLQSANIESYDAKTGAVVINTYTAADGNEADITGAIHMLFMVEGG